MLRVQGFLEAGTVDRDHGERRVDMDRLYQNGGSPLGPALISYDAISCGPPIESVVVDQRHMLLMLLFIHTFIDYDFRLQRRD
ncbi:hypothetical protein B0H14DRAFT_3444371 [Mycena olivaceomarginata]|nr:hypothetical protein B0H14DRAFT_3516928 [Mycena olivaceomarginata]KAJ7862885.1 hypothetical protein B0H14DRAFT_3444371 [Mycena olivaceomarginata]